MSNPISEDGNWEYVNDEWVPNESPAILPPPPAASRPPMDMRPTIDQQGIMMMTSQGWKMGMQMGDMVSMEKPAEVNHVAHAIAFIFTFGFWLIPWAIIALTAKPEVRVFRLVEA